jgi:hypothetical protein
MSSKRSSLPSLYLVGILLSAGACNSTGPASSDYEISGTVRDKGTATPIAGATVYVLAPGLYTSTTVTQQITGADGKYDIKFNARCPGSGRYYVLPSKWPTYVDNTAGKSFDCLSGSAVIDFDLTATP